MINKSTQGVSDKTIKEYYALEAARASSLVTHNHDGVNYFDYVAQRIKRYFQKIARRG